MEFQDQEDKETEKTEEIERFKDLSSKWVNYDPKDLPLPNYLIQRIFEFLNCLELMELTSLENFPPIINQLANEVLMKKITNCSCMFI